MKYYCPVCKSDYCFDGSTEETIKNDVKQHETHSSMHLSMLKEINNLE